MSIAVTLSFPTGLRKDILLAGVPRVGEHVRLRSDDMGDPSWVVRQILWMEIQQPSEPHVIAVVQPFSEAVG